ncbi:MAG TPA: efflux RND transporter periplasmic adaptor subunit [Steroidobacteraceae bacterium]|nr:efflux RND transporter periplasmic adaptor subunit [Steroidobacteraceae bacterium]
MNARIGYSRRRAARLLGCSLLALLVPGLPAAAAEAASAEHLVLPAEVVAYQSVLLTAKVAGYLKHITVDKGDRVKEGQLIAELEVPELLADQIRDRAQFDVAQRVYERMQNAARTAPDLVTPDSLDNAHGQLEVAQAELTRVQALLAYARVTAPFSGVVTARYVDAGAFIPVPSQSAQSSAAIISLMDFSHVRIQMWVPETEAPRVRPGTQATFTAAALPGRKFNTTVTRVSYALESSARTMLAEIDMANPREVLQPGMYLSVTLTPTPAIDPVAGNP